MTMGKAVKPKVNPKIQRLKRMPIDELDRVTKQAAIKAVTKATKAVKMNLILKCTKRISALKKDGTKSEGYESENKKKSNQGKNDESSSSEVEEDADNYDDDNDNDEKVASTSNDNNKLLESEVTRLHDVKSINHVSIGKFLAYQRYPKLFSHELNASSDDVAPDTIQLIKSHKKFSEALGKMDSEITLLQTQKEEQLRKQQNILNAQSVTKKPSRLGKAAAHNAIFLDSLQDESENEESEDNGDKSEIGSEEAEIEKRREKWKMEKAARNQQNREANKLKRDQEKQQGGSTVHDTTQRNGKKTDLSAYMPVNQRDKYRERVFGEKRPTRNIKQAQGLNRAERRKLEREQGKVHSAADHSVTTNDDSVTHSKKVIFDEEPSVKRQRVEAPASSASVSTNSYFGDIPKKQRQHNHQAPQETRRNDNKDLTQFAVTGKEWKESGVHPSWAAKQLSKPQIVQGQGKKITFDE